MPKQLILDVHLFHTHVSIIFYYLTILKFQIYMSCTNHWIEIDVKGVKEFIDKILQIFSSFSLLFPFLSQATNLRLKC